MVPKTSSREMYGVPPGLLASTLKRLSQNVLMMREVGAAPTMSRDRETGWADLFTTAAAHKALCEPAPCTGRGTR